MNISGLPGILSSARRREFVNPYDWTLRTLNCGTSPNEVFFGSGDWTCVSRDGSGSSDISTSTDAITWTNRSANREMMFDVHFADSIWCTGGNAGFLMTATDPTGAWTSRTSSFGATSVNSFNNDGTTWCSVGNSGKMATATDATGTWTQRTSGFGATQIEDIDWDGTYFVAVGFDGKLTTATDPTGTWTARTSSFGATRVMCAAYSPHLGLWAISGRDGKLATASDPTGTWTQRTTGLAGTEWITRVIWDSTANLFVAVGKDDSVSAVSQNGIDWILDDVVQVNTFGGNYGDGYIVLTSSAIPSGATSFN